jgi:2'-hydroxyisoflavone reductase
MHMLIIGGTLFLGRHIVEAALGRNHTLTLLNRGKTDAALFPDVEQIHADRDGGLAVLGERRFDAVIDTCGYVPRVVEQSAAYLDTRCDFYLFVSSISVYARFEADADETAPLAELTEPASENVQKHYGPLKIECERAVERHFPGRAQHARAGFIVGPFDRIERFPYWVQRLRAGGATLAPGARDNPIQWIDARDLANWLVESAELKRAGAFDLTGPERPWPIGRFLDTMNAALGGKAELVWPGDEFLERNQVSLMDGIAYWIPKRLAGICRRRTARAVSAGLQFRPLEETTRDTAEQIARDGFTTNNEIGVQIRTGMTSDRERELLARLQAHANQHS